MLLISITNLKYNGSSLFSYINGFYVVCDTCPSPPKNRCIVIHEGFDDSRLQTFGLHEHNGHPNYNPFWFPDGTRGEHNRNIYFSETKTNHYYQPVHLHRKITFSHMEFHFLYAVLGNGLLCLEKVGRFVLFDCNFCILERI
jgi:hypothetical protein